MTILHCKRMVEYATIQLAYFGLLYGDITQSQPLSLIHFIYPRRSFGTFPYDCLTIASGNSDFDWRYS